MSAFEQNSVCVGGHSVLVVLLRIRDILVSWFKSNYAFFVGSEWTLQVRIVSLEADEFVETLEALQIVLFEQLEAVLDF